MINDKGLNNYRKLLYFFANEIPVHFKLENGDWRNGYIIDLSEIKLTLILKELKMGTIPLLLEEIKENSIEEFREKK